MQGCTELFAALRMQCVSVCVRKQRACAQRIWPPAYLVVCKQDSRKQSGGEC